MIGLLIVPFIISPMLLAVSMVGLVIVYGMIRKYHLIIKRLL